VTVPTTSDLSYLAAGPSVALAGGPSVTLRSTDGGMTWQDASSGVTSAFADLKGLSLVEFVNGSFAGFGQTGYYVTSPDGLAWSVVTVAGNVHPSDVAYGGGTYVVIAVSGTSGKTGAFVTTDLAAPGSLLLPSNLNGLRIAYGNGIFVATEDIAPTTVSRSTDGMTWTVTSSTPPFNSVRFVGSQFFFPGYSGLVARSSDPTSISALTSTTTDVQNLSAIAGNGTTLVAVGRQIVRSQDSGVSFQTVSTSASSRLRAVAVSDGTAGVAQFVVVGDKGRILTSNDGITFSDTGFLGEPTSFSSVAYDHGIFVVMDDNSGQSYTSPTGFS
jgi:hypothetical protein